MLFSILHLIHVLTVIIWIGGLAFITMLVLPMIIGMPDALQKVLKGRTSIIIAHRLSTIQNVNRILVMHKGHLVEEGTHRELLARGGIYTKLYELQYRDQERRVRGEVRHA